MAWAEGEGGGSGLAPAARARVEERHVCARATTTTEEGRRDRACRRGVSCFGCGKGSWCQRGERREDGEGGVYARAWDPAPGVGRRVCRRERRRTRLVSGLTGQASGEGRGRGRTRTHSSSRPDLLARAAGRARVDRLAAPAHAHERERLHVLEAVHRVLDLLLDEQQALARLLCVRRERQCAAGMRRLTTGRAVESLAPWKISSSAMRAVAVSNTAA